MRIKLEITDEEINKIVESFSNTKSCKEWSEIAGISYGFRNGMKYMIDLINNTIIQEEC